jgi:hypothetical protein
MFDLSTWAVDFVAVVWTVEIPVAPQCKTDAGQIGTDKLGAFTIRF